MPRSVVRALRLYKQAAERGHLQAQTNLAVMLLDGDGAKKDIGMMITMMPRSTSALILQNYQTGPGRASQNTRLPVFLEQ